MPQLLANYLMLFEEMLGLPGRSEEVVERIPA